MLRKILHSICKTCVPNRSTTVRRAFPVLAIALVVAGAAATITSDADVSEVVVEISPDKVGAQEEFTISISAIAHTPANTIDIEIEYPKSQIEILGIDTGESVISLWTVDPYWEDGVMYFRGGVFRRGFVGKHLVANVRARGTQTGTAVITTADARFLAGDGRGTEIEVSNSEDSESRVYISREGETIYSETEIVGRITLQVITDLDGDGEVTLSDISRFMYAWRTGNEALDFNGDGRMTFKDFAIILADSFFK